MARSYETLDLGEVSCSVDLLLCSKSISHSQRPFSNNFQLYITHTRCMQLVKSQFFSAPVNYLAQANRRFAKYICKRCASTLEIALGEIQTQIPIKVSHIYCSMVKRLKNTLRNDRLNKQSPQKIFCCADRTSDCNGAARGTGKGNRYYTFEFQARSFLWATEFLHDERHRDVRAKTGLGWNHDTLLTLCRCR